MKIAAFVLGVVCTLVIVLLIAVTAAPRDEDKEIRHRAEWACEFWGYSARHPRQPECLLVAVRYSQWLDQHPGREMALLAQRCRDILRYDFADCLYRFNEGLPGNR